MRMLLAPAIAAAALAAAPPALTHAAAPPTLTHVQLVARADAICVRYGALLNSPPGVEGRLGEADYDQAWLRLFTRQRTELARLPAPRRDRAYARFLASLPPVATTFRTLADALEAGEPVKRWRPLFHRFRDAERTAGRAARAVGMRRCFAGGRSGGTA
jgi:hypothetical protein